jgi:DNA repair protein RadC
MLSKSKLIQILEEKTKFTIIQLNNLQKIITWLALFKGTVSRKSWPDEGRG